MSKSKKPSEPVSPVASPEGSAGTAKRLPSILANRNGQVLDRELLDFLEYSLLESHVRQATLTIMVKTFPGAGVRFRILGCEWRPTLREAFAAYRYKVLYAANRPTGSKEEKP